MLHQKPTIVITGASSFVGCHLVRRFSQRGWRTLGTGRYPASHYEDLPAQRVGLAGPEASWEVLDIKDKNAVRKFIANVKPQFWIHHAGYTIDHFSTDYDIHQANEVNVKPIEYIFEALAQNDCRGVVVTGSSIEYSDIDRPHLETDLCTPSTPYGQSKLAETQTALDLASRLGMPVRVARLFIPFGPLDDPRKLISHVLINLEQRKPVDLSLCEQRRDFVYIDRVVDAYELLINDLDRGGTDIFNLSSGQATAVRDVVNWVTEEVGASKSLLNFGARPMRTGEQMVLYGSNHKVRTILGWVPGDMRDGISSLIKDFRK